METNVAKEDAENHLAHALTPAERVKIAVNALSGKTSVAELARLHGVSRKFVACQSQLAAAALRNAFEQTTWDKKVLYYLPVTRHWIKQYVLVMLLVCRCSFRGVTESLDCLFDYRNMSIGQVSGIAEEAKLVAGKLNASECLSNIKATAQDEIFQSGKPVLAGLDQQSTYCFLLSEEKKRDAETWAIRLMECKDRGLNPRYSVADGGQGQRAGMRMVWPGKQCYSDTFHVIYELEKVKTYLEHKALSSIAALDDINRRMEKASIKNKGNSFSRKLGLRRVETARRIALHDDFSMLVDWLRLEVLEFNELSPGTRGDLFDWIVLEIQKREELCPQHLPQTRKYLQNQRSDILASFVQMDKDMLELSKASGADIELLRRIATIESKADCPDIYSRQRTKLCKEFGWEIGQLHVEVREIMDNTHKTSSVVENLNSRLRCYFFLRRQIGKNYLGLLRFFLNHRRFPRSDKAERVGKSPAELLSGESHPHWLDLLGYQRFVRS